MIYDLLDADADRYAIDRNANGPGSTLGAARKLSADAKQKVSAMSAEAIGS